MEATTLLARTHYPRPVVREGVIVWHIIGPIAQSGLTCYDIMDAARMCQHLDDELLAYDEEGYE